VHHGVLRDPPPPTVGELLEAPEVVTTLKQVREAEFARIWCEIFTENAAMRATLEPLAGRVPMRLLSNTSGLHKEHLLAEFGIFQPFDGGVYSYSAKCSKPGEAIFRKTIEELDLDPALTFYIDDLEPNIATARRLGFEAHHYDARRHDEFERELNEIGRASCRERV
jgi:putative hydrolase of the HAD superfamily